MISVDVDLKIGDVEEPRPSYVQSMPVGLGPWVCCTFSNVFGLGKYIEEVYMFIGVKKCHKM